MARWGAAKDDTGVGLKVLLAMETFSRFQCAADLKFISFFKGLFFCSRSRVFIFFLFCKTKMRSKDVILYSLSQYLTVAELSPLVIGRQIVVALIPRGCAKLPFHIRIRFSDMPISTYSKISPACRMNLQVLHNKKISL